MSTFTDRSAAPVTANRRIVVAANSSWNIVNFREGLVRALQAAGYEPIIAAPIDPASAERMAQLGVEHIAVDLSRSGMNPVADARLFLKYRRILKRVRPYAFLGFTIKPNVYGSLAARSLGVPAIANISGLGTTFANHGLLRRAVSRLYRFSLARNATVFFQNPDDQAEFVDGGLVRPEQARLLPGSGVDLEHFASAPLPTGALTFLLVARLLADKGIREYVEAARILRERYPDSRFQLLGPLDRENPTAISAEELQKWVDHGAIDYLGTTDDVRPFIRAASVIVLPSYYREGVPRSLLEGAAMGRPLIATDEPGCRELVVDSCAGLPCRARDAADLARVMERLLTMPRSELTAMGAAARRLVEERFNETLVFEAYLDALDRL